jgi:hypothetical protein
VGKPTFMLFHFQLAGPYGWEALGSGVGSGEDALTEALADLEELFGGELPRGEFRCIEIRGRDSRWVTFEVGAGGPPDLSLN